MLLLAACLLGQLRFDDTSSPPTAVRPESPAAVSLRRWTRADGSWMPPLDWRALTPEWRNVTLHRWRTSDGRVVAHPDRATGAAWFAANESRLAAGRATFASPAHDAAPTPYFAAPAPAPAWCVGGD